MLFLFAKWEKKTSSCLKTIENHIHLIIQCSGNVVVIALSRMICAGANSVPNERHIWEINSVAIYSHFFSCTFILFIFYHKMIKSFKYHFHKQGTCVRVRVYLWRVKVSQFVMRLSISNQRCWNSNSHIHTVI